MERGYTMHNKIKELCEKKGVTIKDALTACGIPESSYYTARERGSLMSFKAMAKLAEYFNVPMEFFKDE